MKEEGPAPLATDLVGPGSLREVLLDRCPEQFLRDPTDSFTVTSRYAVDGPFSDAGVVLAPCSTLGSSRRQAAGSEVVYAPLSSARLWSELLFLCRIFRGAALLRYDSEIKTMEPPAPLQPSSSRRSGPRPSPGPSRPGCRRTARRGGGLRTQFLQGQKEMPPGRSRRSWWAAAV